MDFKSAVSTAAQLAAVFNGTDLDQVLVAITVLVLLTTLYKERTAKEAPAGPKGRCARKGTAPFRKKNKAVSARRTRRTGTVRRAKEAATPALRRKK